MANNGLFSWLSQWNPIKKDPVNPMGDQEPVKQNTDLAKNQIQNKIYTYNTTLKQLFNRNRETDNSKELKEKQQQLQALIKKFYGVIESRKELLSTLESFRSNDVVQTILDVLIDDGFYSSSNPEIFTVEYKGKVEKDLIQKIIDDLVSNQSLNDLVVDILEDFLLLGEHLLSLEIKQGQGIVSIKDDVKLSNVYGVYSGNKRSGFLVKENGKLKTVPPNTYAHFVLSPRKLRVELEGTETYTPSYLRIGRPIILSAINKIKQLQTIEMGNLALDLKQILAPVLVLVGIPAITTPDEATEIVEKYEKHLSDVFDTSKLTEDFDLSDMLAIASKIKVLPNYSDGKGSIETLQIDTDKQADREREESIRRNITSSIGMPPNYLSIQDTQGSNKIDNLKIYSRYSRKLNSIQYSVAKGIKEIIVFHLQALGKDVNPDDIVIKMRSIINVDLLDNMEFLLTISSGIGDFFDSLTRITESEELNLKLNTEKFLKFLESIFNNLPNAEGLIEFQKPQQTPTDDTNLTS